LVILALLAAVVLRVAVPVGYMPAPLASGWPVQLCPDGLSAEVMVALFGPSHQHHAAPAPPAHHHHGTATPPVDAAHAEAPPEVSQALAQHCPLAAFAALAVVSGPGTLTPLALADRGPAPQIQRARILRHPCPAAQPRAPPLPLLLS
jgi:hypothetical protein